MRKPKALLAAVLLAAYAIAACAVSGRSQQPAEPVPAQYVAMGSSFAAGPGVAQRALGTPPQCAQSTENYPRLFAQARGLTLRDASCSGATTENILHGGQGLPPQLDAVTPATKLVTVTIGGNDVAFIRNLYVWSCRNQPTNQIAPAGSAPRHCGEPMPEADVEAAFAGLEDRMRQIAVKVHRRAPAATLVFVDYIRIVPESGACFDRLPLTAAQLDRTRQVAARLAALTAQTARDNNALLLTASALSADHAVCSADPWAMPFHAPTGTASDDFAPYHPDAAAMHAIAAQLEVLLPAR